MRSINRADLPVQSTADAVCPDGRNRVGSVAAYGKAIIPLQGHRVKRPYHYGDKNGKFFPDISQISQTAGYD
jgi:hypothetical protein